MCLEVFACQKIYTMLVRLHSDILIHPLLTVHVLDSHYGFIRLFSRILVVEGSPPCTLPGDTMSDNSAHVLYYIIKTRFVLLRLLVGRRVALAVKPASGLGFYSDIFSSQST